MNGELPVEPKSDAAHPGRGGWPTAPSELVPTSHAAIAAGLERFAAAHRDELTPAQVFTLGEAAGILHRTHPDAG